ncbi:hypothetical protein [Sphingomonas sp. SORGH_AS_0879]|uniref:hypothetical protein n=1 Tax=Sphingomonas sp. SORGH_AS_0879 TaxID=3041790 RepID=UPI00278432FA|nr:hypothetical protein [Sphingomonas sp. SORGH_AS_0879]MDQ1231577.1 hypothetical protein [Sphingomonas sp. SORGH_AS_0879]
MMTGAPPPADSGDKDETVGTGMARRDARNPASPMSILTGATRDRTLHPHIGGALARLSAFFTPSVGPDAWRPVG